MLVLSARANSHVDVGNPSSIVRHPNKVTSLVEVGTSGTRLLPSWEYLFDLSKYVSEQESHAILNGIRDKIRFDAPPEYTLVNSFMDVDKSIPVKTTAPEASTDANRRPKRKFVEGMEGHTGASTKKQQVEDSETDYGVVAIKFLDPDFGVWWKGGQYTQEPLRNLTGIDCSAIERARTKKKLLIKTQNLSRGGKKSPSCICMYP